jgi:hypothetical protein
MSDLKRGLMYLAYGMGIAWCAAGMASDNLFQSFVGGLMLGAGGMFLGFKR